VTLDLREAERSCRTPSLRYPTRAYQSRPRVAKTRCAVHTDQTNEARDLDVLAAQLHADGAEAMLDALEAARQGAYARAGKALRSERAGRLLWRGARPSRKPVLVAAAETASARKLAAGALRRRRRRLVRRGGRLERMGPHDRHRLRVRVKKTRYAIELFGDLFAHPHRRRRMGAALRGLQDSLGELNDIRMNEALAERLSSQAGTAQAGFQAGLIVGRRSGARKKLLKRAVKSYERFVEARPFC